MGAGPLIKKDTRLYLPAGQHSLQCGRFPLGDSQWEMGLMGLEIVVLVGFSRMGS